MKRKIIKINEDKCNGCGFCIPNCPEGALQIIDGKARLISDLFCDGLGACVKKCPLDAMQIEERDAEPYEEGKAMENIVLGGANVIKAHLLHLKEHGEEVFLQEAISFLKARKIDVPNLDLDKPCGCPGMMQKTLNKPQNISQSVSNVSLVSQLNNWPIQLKLLNPNAQYLHNADLLIAADCSAFTYANFHNKFLREKVLVMFCPKLDADLNSYVDKLALIFEKQEIKSITIVKMEVPCCGGVEEIVKQALEKSSKNIFVKSYTIGLNGEVI